MRKKCFPFLRIPVLNAEVSWGLELKRKENPSLLGIFLVYGTIRKRYTDKLENKSPLVTTSLIQDKLIL